MDPGTVCCAQCADIFYVYFFDLFQYDTEIMPGIARPGQQCFFAGIDQTMTTSPRLSPPPRTLSRASRQRWRVWVVVPAAIVVLLGLLLTYRLIDRKMLQARDSRLKSDVSLPVKVIHTGQQDIVRSSNHSGVVQAWQQAILLAEVPGTVETINARIGEPLDVGSLILRLDDEMLGYTVEQARAQVLQLEAGHETSLRELTRKRSLYKNKVISDFEFDIAKAKEKADRALLDSARASLKIAERDLRETAVTSPIAGILAERTVDIGTTVARGTRLATVVDIEQVKITIGVSEREIADIREGLPVAVTTDAYPGYRYSGTVYSVGTKADDRTLTFPIEILIVNDTPPILKPGMVASTSIRTGLYNDVIALPQEAVMKRGDTEMVWTIDRDQARPVHITTADVIDSRVIVTSGLKPGQAVVVSGQEILADGSPVTIVP